VIAVIDLQPMEVCTDLCVADSDCPLGFDCRPLEVPGGLQICVVGISTAGQPSSLDNCYHYMLDSRVLVLGDDGQEYCSDICDMDGQIGQTACPKGFHCGSAYCECNRQTSWGGCLEIICGETTYSSESNVEYDLCFPNPGFGITCSIDADCKVGDYCGSDGNCRLDDRFGCTVCMPCYSDRDCGALGQGQLCDPTYACNVPCREDLPCPSGLVCNADGVCINKSPTTDAQSDLDEALEEAEGCSCSHMASPGQKGFWLILLMMFLRSFLIKGQLIDRNNPNFPQYR